jgi:hypothetical protein
MWNREAKQLLKRFEEAKQERYNFQNHWRDIARVISPSDAEFNENPTSRTNKHYEEIRDSVGIKSNELLTSGFFSLLTSPTQPWFQLKTTDRELNENRDVALWISQVTKIMLYEIQRPQTGFTSAMQEFYSEYGQYGNATLFVTEKKNLSSLLFYTIPLMQSYFIENDEGFIDTLIRYYARTAYQLFDRFGMNGLPENVVKALNADDLSTKFEILHFIMPNKFANASGLRSSNMPFVSIYLEKGSQKIINVSGYHEQPFMSTRFYKSSHEVYGRGPGSVALADLNMLQAMSDTTIRGAQKIVDPAIQMPDQGFITPPRLGSGMVNYYRSGSADRITPVMTGGQPMLGIELINRIDNKVREAFFVDQLQLNIGPQMTATEVLQRTEEKQRLMGPVIGRASTELLSPMIIRCFALLMRAGKFPPMPEVLIQAGPNFQIVFTSPIFKAQEQIQANNIMRTQQIMLPFLGADPTAMDIYNLDAMSRDIGEIFNLNPEYFRSEEEVAAMRQQRTEAAMQANQAQQLKDTGIGVNNLASAGRTLGEMN